MEIFDNIVIRTLPLPLSVKGVTIPSNDNFYNIYINSNYSIETMNETLKHELKHIDNFDFDNFDDISFVENRACEI